MQFWMIPGAATTVCCAWCSGTTRTSYTQSSSKSRPREVMVGRQVRLLEDSLIHRTESGDLVRSKSEVIIADKLFARGVDYAYEQPLTLPNGSTRYPDFTIADPARGVTFYWEHLGLLDDPAYRTRWERKRVEYLAPETGIKHWQEPGDSARATLRPGP